MHDDDVCDELNYFYRKWKKNMNFRILYYIVMMVKRAYVCSCILLQVENNYKHNHQNVAYFIIAACIPFIRLVTKTVQCTYFRFQIYTWCWLTILYNTIVSSTGIFRNFGASTQIELRTEMKVP